MQIATAAAMNNDVVKKWLKWRWRRMHLHLDQSVMIVSNGTVLSEAAGHSSDVTFMSSHSM